MKDDAESDHCCLFADNIDILGPESKRDGCSIVLTVGSSLFSGAMTQVVQWYNTKQCSVFKKC